MVYSIVRASRCYNCDVQQAIGSLVQLKQGQDEKEVLCAQCAGIASLEFLASGNAKVTQAAKKKSTRVLVVLRWSEVWKCYERQGLLLESKAIDDAEAALGIKVKGRANRART